MTNPQNPSKKHRTIKKAQKRLEIRTKMYENAIRNGNNRAYKKPGSMKMHS